MLCNRYSHFVCPDLIFLRKIPDHHIGHLFFSDDPDSLFFRQIGGMETIDHKPVASPKPVAARAINDQVGNDHIAHLAPVDIHKGYTPVRVHNQTVDDGHIPHGVHVAVTKLDRAGRGGQAAIRYCYIFTEEGRPEPVHGIENNRVITGFDGAIGYSHIPATQQASIARWIAACELPDFCPVAT